MLWASPSQTQDLYGIPDYLRAAIYASALKFGGYDDVLCVLTVYQKSSADKLWQIVYDGIQNELHTPRLATISAALLFLNRPRTGIEQVSHDTPFVWSFMASTIALVTSLGLHLECKDWYIPEWEKRLRRRLWWMSYNEEKWRSILVGRPSVIAADQWNVSDLSFQDFRIDPILIPDNIPEELIGLKNMLRNPDNCMEVGLYSQHMAKLGRVADKIYTNL